MKSRPSIVIAQDPAHELEHQRVRALIRRARAHSYSGFTDLWLDVSLKELAHHCSRHHPEGARMTKRDTPVCPGCGSTTCPTARWMAKHGL